MLGREQLQEILETLSANKLRTALTGFSVGWGVLLLVILLSSGMGLRNAMVQNMSNAGYDDQSSELYFYSISIPHNGLPQWYSPTYTEEDARHIVKQLQGEVTLYAPYTSLWGNLTRQDRSANINVEATTPAFTHLRSLRYLASGSRFINEQDEQEERKVIVLSDATARTLFDSLEEAIGQRVFFKGLSFTVVGIYQGSRGQWSSNYIPLAVAKVLERQRGLTGIYLLTPNITNDEGEAKLSKRILSIASALKGFSPQDERAISLRSQASQQALVGKITLGIDIFLWIIGLSTLGIGLVGVVSIMQIAVTERKREIGIRKALGARPRAIITMVLTESVFITLISGLIGLIIGVGIMSLVSFALAMNAPVPDPTKPSPTLFTEPILSFATALGTILVMVLGGLIAGYLPARKAVRIPTVEAMRH